MTIFLIFLSLTLTCIVGFQIVYFFYLERVSLQRKNHIRDLEKRNKILSQKLADAEYKLTHQAVFTQNRKSTNTEDEIWADVIDIER